MYFKENQAPAEEIKARGRLLKFRSGGEGNPKAAVKAEREPEPTEAVKVEQGPEPKAAVKVEREPGPTAAVKAVPGTTSDTRSQ